MCTATFDLLPLVGLLDAVARVETWLTYREILERLDDCEIRWLEGQKLCLIREQDSHAIKTFILRVPRHPLVDPCLKRISNSTIHAIKILRAFPW